MEIMIPDRLYHDIELYCESNGLDIEKYCLTALRNQIAIDKYGDLNDVVAKNESQTKQDVIIETVKVVEETKIPVVEEKKLVVRDTVTEVVSENTVSEDNQNKVKHRTIKTK